jgi:hypothetical protein
MHLTLLALTGILMGCLTTFVGLPGLAEEAGWVAAYVLWVVYGVRFKLDSPVRTMAVASTLTGLLASSIQVLFMEAYKANNSFWSAEYFSGDSQNAAIQFLSVGIVRGLAIGLVVGLITRTIIRRAS